MKMCTVTSSGLKASPVLRGRTQSRPPPSLLCVDGFIVSALGVAYYDLFFFNKIHKHNYFKAFCYYFLQGDISRKPQPSVLIKA